MINYAEALLLLRESGRRRTVPVEKVPIEQAVGRIVAETVGSPEAIPSFDNSAMDGFAVVSRRTTEASKDRPMRIRVAGTIMAGDEPPQEQNDTIAWEIMTGAPMPRGPQDAVIKIEEVEVTRDAQGRAMEIALKRAVTSQENVRECGEDFRTGQTVLVEGTRLLPEHVMALASLGISSVRVRARPRIAIISTGDELVHHETRELKPGTIRNSTGPYLAAAASFYGADARFYGTVRDSTEEFLVLLDTVRAEKPDLILTTGAVSMGQRDFIPEALERVGARTFYHKVAIRPGKPGIFAELPASDGVPGPVFLGSPGNPISTAVALRFFVWPYLRELQRLPPERPSRAVLTQESTKPEGLRCFFKARLEADETGQRVVALKGQPSFMVSPLLQANAWVISPEAGTSVPAGSIVEVYPIYPDPKEGALP